MVNYFFDLYYLNLNKNWYKYNNKMPSSPLKKGYITNLHLPQARSVAQMKAINTLNK